MLISTEAVTDSHADDLAVVLQVNNDLYLVQSSHDGLVQTTQEDYEFQEAVGVWHSVETVPNFLDGDYNYNGIVDAADYALWRDTLGQTVTAFWGADGNGNGMIDDLDYAVWKTHFGMTLGTTGNLATTSVASENQSSANSRSQMPLQSVVLTADAVVNAAQSISKIADVTGVSIQPFAPTIDSSRRSDSPPFTSRDTQVVVREVILELTSDSIRRCALLEFLADRPDKDHQVGVQEIGVRTSGFDHSLDNRADPISQATVIDRVFRVPPLSLASSILEHDLLVKSVFVLLTGVFRVCHRSQRVAHRTIHPPLDVARRDTGGRSGGSCWLAATRSHSFS